MPTRFLAIGDLHLEKLGRIFGEIDHIGLQLQCLYDAAAYALDHDIQRIILLGDIFETPHPEQKTIRRLLEALNGYPRVEFHIIRGNHDVSSTQENSLELLDFISELRAISNVELYLSPTRANWDGVRMCFLSYPYLKPLKSSKPQLVLAHQELAGAIRDNGMTIPKSHGQPKIAHRDYWIIGHLHQHQQGKRYCYPGTMMQMNFGESLPKGFLRVTANYSEQLTVKTKYIKYHPPFRLINLPVKSKRDLEQIKSRSHYRYKVILTPKAKLPLGWRNQYPNIVNVVGVKEEQQIEQELVGQLSLDQTTMIDEVDITRNLDGYLKARGYRSKDRQFGKRKIQQILARKK